MTTWSIIQHDIKKGIQLPDESVQCVVTSPPYWGLRDYGVKGQIGLEPTIEEHLSAIVSVCREIRRVLKPDGVLWLNYGDRYNTSKTRASWGDQANDERGYDEHGKRRLVVPGLHPKNMLGLPWMVAFALQKDKWILRSEVIWHKTTPMPESVLDRPTCAHDHIFLLSKNPQYFWNWEAVATPTKSDSLRSSGRQFGGLKYSGTKEQYAHNRYSGDRYKPGPLSRLRDVWPIANAGFNEAHFATFPQELARLCILSSSRPGDLVADPFCGSGQSGVVAVRHGRDFYGQDLNPEYCEMSRRRIESEAALPLFDEQKEAAI